MYLSVISGVLEEAEFYNITPLIKLIKERILERDCKASQVISNLKPYSVYAEQVYKRNLMLVGSAQILDFLENIRYDRLLATLTTFNYGTIPMLRKKNTGS